MAIAIVILLLIYVAAVSAPTLPWLAEFISNLPDSPQTGAKQPTVRNRFGSRHS